MSLIAGVRVAEWIDMFFATRALTSIGLIGDTWPAGGTYLEQEFIVTKVFEIIKDATLTFVERQRRK